MLSLYTLKSASEASRYYQQGDYYTQKEVDSQTAWVGKGAQGFGLKRSVSAKIFTRLLQGELPNGQKMIQVQKNQRHRPGYDLTFSAPKSVSLLALVLGNGAILQAHRQAVKETLNRVEKAYAGCRRKQNGMTTIERTQNLIIATFEHVDSREGDPQLHSHCVLMNCTQRKDGAWRTLYADELYRNKRLIGLMYRSSLAHQLLSLGFELEVKEKGLFEIKGVPQLLIDWTSKRRAQIKEWLKEHHQTGGEAAIQANFLTRRPKAKLNPEERQTRWLAEVEALGELGSLRRVVEEAKARGPVLPPAPQVLANQAVRLAIEELSEWQTHFTVVQLVRTSKQLSYLEVNEGELLSAVERQFEEKRLLYLEDKTLTTPEVQALVQISREQAEKAKAAVCAVSPRWMAKFMSRFMSVDPRERHVLIRVLTSTDRQILLESSSPVLLDQALQNLVSLTKAYRFYPRVLVQTRLEAEALKETLGAKVHTVEGFLLSGEKRLEKMEIPSRLGQVNRRLKSWVAQDIWIVRGEISLQQLNRLGIHAETLSARIVFANTKPCVALEAIKGRGLTELTLHATHHQLENLSTKARALTEINRLEQCQRLMAVEPNRLESAAVEAYLKLDREPKALVSFYAGDIFSLNNQVRSALRDREMLTGEAKAVSILRPLFLSQAEKAQIFSYQPGDRVRFKDDYFEVMALDVKQGYLLLEQGENTLRLQPQALKEAEVFKPELREVQQGDILRWTRGVRLEDAPSRIKGQAVVVVAVSADYIKVQTGEGLIQLNPKAFSDQHWEYGYSVSLASLEREVQAAVIIVREGALNPKILHSLTTVLSQARHHRYPIQIVCQDANTLKQAIQNTGVVQTPSEVVTPYQREQAVAQSFIADQSLFNGLQKACINLCAFDVTVPVIKPPPLPRWATLTPHFRAAIEVVDKVCLYHSERHAVISLETLKQESLRFGAYLSSVADLEKAVRLVMQQGWMRWVGKDEENQPLFAARHTLLIEKWCIEKMKAGQDQLRPILEPESPALQEILKNDQLTLGQKSAIEGILTTKDRLTIVQGIAGSGKTTALKELQRLCQGSYELVVLANTSSAKNQAKQISNLKAQTTAQFLTEVERAVNQDLEQAKRSYGGQRLYLVDEASLLSSIEVLKLQFLVEKLRSRKVLMGDFKQQGSLGAGFSFHDLLAYGARQVVLRENVRLTDRTAFTAMKQVYAGEISQALETLKLSIEEIPDKTEALTRIAQLYAGLSSSRPILLITPLNADRRFVNEKVREYYKEQGALDKQGIVVDILVAQDRGEGGKKEVGYYTVGDWIRFNVGQPRLGIKNGEYAKVLSIDLPHQRLYCVINQQLFYWSPKNLKQSKHIEIYRQETRELCLQDEIVFKRNQESLGIFNGDTARILKQDDGQIDCLLMNGQTVTLDITQKQNQHWDYGYALTTLPAQGKDVPFVIAYLEGPKPFHTTTEALKVGDVVALSREARQAREGDASQVVQLIRKQASRLTLKNRAGETFAIEAKPNDHWLVFPPFEDRHPKHLPLSTSQQSFLIEISRGNEVILFTPYVDYLEKTLEKHAQIKRSALSYQDKDWPALNQKIKQLVDNIKGLVEPLPLTPPSKDPLTVLDAKPQAAQVIERAASEKRAKPLKPFSFKRRQYVDKEDVVWRLNQNPLGYASRWLGQPKKVSGREARWPGALTVQVRGSHVGRWKSWSSGEGGRDLISLYAYAHNVDWKTALQELADNLGVMSTEDVFVSKPKEPGSEAERQDKIEKAKRLYSKAVNISASLAATYLREHRGIKGVLPQHFRYFDKTFHFETQEAVSALLAPIQNKEGQIIGVHKIFLNRDGSKYDKTYVTEDGKVEKAIAKVSSGVVSGGAVIVHQGVIPTTLWVTEGIETALSIVQAEQRYTTLASLSVNQLKNVPVAPEVQTIVICADKDEVGSGSSKTTIEAIEHYIKQGKQVFLALPLGPGKCDFNDLLKKEGVEGVRRSLDQMVEIKDVEGLKREGLIGMARRMTEKLDKTFGRNQGAQREINKEMEF